MSSDKSTALGPPHGSVWQLPEISEVRIRAKAYQPRATTNFQNPLEAAKNAVEFLVTLRSAVPARALAPVLHVGEARLTESEPIDKEGKQLRFWAFDRSVLKPGAAILIAWAGEEVPKAKGKARFTYRLED